jgi:hypothetical protein
MIGRVALLVTFKKAKPKPQSLSRSHIRDLATIWKMRRQGSEIEFMCAALLILWSVNLATYFIDSFFDIKHIGRVSLDGVLVLSLTWAISIFLSLKLFKPLPVWLRQPVLRIILWSPIVYLDIVDDRTGIAESPGYFLYLNNQGLLPISSLLLNPLGNIDALHNRLLYFNFVSWIGFAAILSIILYCADRIVKLKQ